VPDHIYDPAGPAFPMFEAYTVLGALAALDVVSGGRAVLGVGAGWDAAEHEAYGIGFPGPGEPPQL
jgi:alkanesulfonate monooxygenase SsuD/methylene tetrahydromethanopterin reductase-like flavin-dependent oxidoreductase (luciferase family)